MSSLDSEWTIADVGALVVGFNAGRPAEALAVELDKTPGRVRWKLNQLGLARLPASTPGVPKPQYDEDVIGARRGDLAFKLAMLAAIKAGAEKVAPGIVRTRGAMLRYVRRAEPVASGAYASSAAMAAEMGGGVSNG